MKLENFKQDKFIVDEAAKLAVVGGGVSYSYRYYASVGFDGCYTTDADADACDMCIE